MGVVGSASQSYHRKTVKRDVACFREYDMLSKRFCAEKHVGGALA